MNIQIIWLFLIVRIEVMLFPAFNIVGRNPHVFYHVLISTYIKLKTGSVPAFMEDTFGHFLLFLLLLKFIIHLKIFVK